MKANGLSEGNLFTTIRDSQVVTYEAKIVIKAGRAKDYPEGVIVGIEPGSEPPYSNVIILTGEDRVIQWE